MSDDYFVMTESGTTPARRARLTLVQPCDELKNAVIETARAYLAAYYADTDADEKAAREALRAALAALDAGST